MKEIKPSSANDSIVVLTREDKSLLRDILSQLDDWYCTKLDIDKKRVDIFLDNLTDL